jgi:hypothetical protein
MAKVPLEVWTVLGVNTHTSWDTERARAREDATRGEQ